MNQILSSNLNHYSTENSSKDRYLQKIIKENFEDIKILPLVKQFIKDKENEELLNEAFEKGDLNIIDNLNTAFQTFFKRYEAIKYVIGIIKRYPIDYDKRVKKRNNRFLLILDKPVKNSNESSTTSLLELVKDPNKEEALSKNIFKDSIFDIENEQLKKVINSLNQNQRTILKLIYEDNYSQREVSRIIGQTEQNIYYWHKKTIKQLQKELSFIS